jgi:retron-type reverse transcriptase
LKNAQNIYKPAKRIFIPITSDNGGAVRPLTLVSPRDKIIQKAISIILHEIYEYSDEGFLNCSHGFRPKKSTHTAL